MLTPSGSRALRTARILLYGLVTVAALPLAVLAGVREDWITAIVLLAVAATAAAAWLRERRGAERPDG
ncbi:hypothetical protein [Streptomyces wuyuanensis]|uniref:hypothetical protein n=1 Tax=Streptomyces wuyuanensis TaxID=1196353 RepID=UPI003D727D24